MDVNEAARFLRMSKWTLYALVRNRKVKYYKGKRLLRFLPEDLDAYLKEAYRMIEPINTVP